MIVKSLNRGGKVFVTFFPEGPSPSVRCFSVSPFPHHTHHSPLNHISVERRHVFSPDHFNEEKLLSQALDPRSHKSDSDFHSSPAGGEGWWDRFWARRGERHERHQSFHDQHHSKKHEAQKRHSTGASKDEVTKNNGNGQGQGQGPEGNGQGKMENGNGQGKSGLHITVIGRQSEDRYTSTEMSLEQVLGTKFGPNYSSSEGPSVWLSVSGATDETFRRLGEKFNLHPLTIEDCQSSSERGREKVEVFQDYTFFIFETTEGAKEIKQDPASLEPTISIRLLVFKNCILSFHPRGVPAIATVKKKLDKVHGYHIPTTAWLVHAILDGIIDAMVPEVDALLRGISDLEGEYMGYHRPHSGHHHRHLRYEDYTLEKKKDTHRQRLQRIAETRKKLLSLRQRLWPKRDILTTLINKDGAAFMSGVQMPYLRDVHDHLLTMSEKVERANDLLNAVQSNYLASISIQLSEQNETLNQVMKQLTGMATICLPLTLVTGLFGMNVPVPLHPDAPSLLQSLADPKLLPFYGVTGAITVSGVVFYYILKRNRMM